MENLSTATSTVEPAADAVTSPGQAPEKPRTRRRRRGDEVRARVISAALETFGMFGYEGTSTRAIADRAGVSHTLVLYHFESKELLWIATMDDTLTSYMSGIRENLATAASRPAADSLRVFIEQFVRLSARLPQIHRIMTMEGNQQSPRIQWLIDNYLRDHFNVVKDLIRRGQDEGSVRDLDAARLYYHIISSGGTPFTLAVEYKQLTGRDVFSESEIYRQIAFIFEMVFA